MAIEVPQNEEISGGGKNGGRKGVCFAELLIVYSVQHCSL